MEDKGIDRSDKAQLSFVPGPINDVPDEILELILSNLSPYRDYRSAMMVCKRWYKVMESVRIQQLENFQRGIHTGNIYWQKLPAELGPTVTDRYSHCACYHDKSMYVFGGCTSTCTTFNDLWRLDLSTGDWIRPLATGVYPSPTACATLVPYKDQLLLFGGWCHPTPYTFHQASKLFNQLHSYTTETNKWTQILSPKTPPGKAGHGATVVKDTMVVFGGYHGQTNSSNQVWVFDLIEKNWRMKDIPGQKPLPRYGHTQVLLDDNHILVVGGCGGPNKQLSDMWVLSMANDPWVWSQVDVVNLQNAAPQLWCHPGCLVGDKIVVLSKNVRLTRTNPPAPVQPPAAVRGVWIPPKEDEIPLPRSRQLQDHRLCSVGPKRTHPETSESSSQESSSDTDEGCMGPPVSAPSRSPRGFHKGVYSSPKRDQPVAGPSGVSPGAAELPISPCSKPSVGVRAGMPSIRPNAMRNRQKQLETLKYYESKIKQMSKPQREMPEVSAASAASSEHSSESGRQSHVQNPMYIHVLDVSKVLTEGKATWMPIHECIDRYTPEETIFHSLVQGRGEVIMFGGIQMDLCSMQKGLHTNNQQVSNSVHFIRAVKKLR